MRRDVTRIHRELMQQGRVFELGDNSDVPAQFAANGDLENTVGRVRALFTDNDR